MSILVYLNIFGLLTVRQNRPFVEVTKQQDDWLFEKYVAHQAIMSVIVSCNPPLLLFLKSKLVFDSHFQSMFLFCFKFFFKEWNCLCIKLRLLVSNLLPPGNNWLLNIQCNKVFSPGDSSGAAAAASAIITVSLLQPVSHTFF